LAEKTVEEAALKAGVPYRTLKSWLALPDFQEVFRAARQEILERGIARLLATVDKAVEALDRNLACGNPAVETRAAVAVLDHATKGVEVLDLAQRVEQLELVLREGTNDGQHPGEETGPAGSLGPITEDDDQPDAGENPSESGVRDEGDGLGA